MNNRINIYMPVFVRHHLDEIAKITQENKSRLIARLIHEEYVRKVEEKEDGKKTTRK